MNRLLTSGLLVLAVCAGGAGYVGWKGHSAKLEWRARVPELPAPVGAASPGLDDRLAALSLRLREYPPDVAALAEFTRVCHANGELLSAIAGYEVLIKLQPAESRWPYRLASILAGYGRLAEAVPHLRRTVEWAPDYLTARLKLAEALLKSNSTTESEAAYQEVLRRDPDNIYGLVGLARCQLQAEQLTFARSTLQRAVAAHPEFSSAQSLLGTVLERLGNVEGAELARNRVRQGGHYAEPADPWMSELLNDCHDPYTLLIASSAAVAESRSADALPILAHGLALAPNDARLHRQLAKTHASMDQLENARVEMERAIALDPTNDAIHLDLLTILRQLPESNAFAEAVARAVTQCPNSAALRFEAGLLAARAGELNAAAEHLTFAWHSRPDQTAAAFEAATVYFRQGKSDLGVALLEEVLRLHPKDSNAHVLLVRHGIETQDPRTGEWLQRAISNDPSAPTLAELRQNYQRRFGMTP